MKSILVIDDNPDIRENTAEILDLAGYQTFTAENGKRGVEQALKNKPDLIVCDIMMPELDGYGVLHLIRKNPETQFTPFIFLSAKTERTDLRKGMEMGADDYITKPFEDIELLNAIEVRLKKNQVFQEKYASSQQGVSQFLKDVKDSGLLDNLADQYEVENYSKKLQLYQEGRRPRFLYYITKGKVKVYKTHEDGKEYITDIFSEGDFLGFHALIEDRNYEDSAVVLEEAEIMQIPKEDFLRMINTDINVAIKFIRIITQNVRQKEERLLSLAYSSLRKRVAKALIDIYQKYNPGSGSRPIEISRDDIAHYIGTATESLIRTLSDFKSEKLIVITDGKVVISDPEKLKALLF
ncbi:MAG: response regulator [Gemmatimonadaceae bacterium]|nr:response regulator [Chitinophagaceae bacterium]